MSTPKITLLTPLEAEKACRTITDTLPEWFAIPQANERYALGIKERTSLGYIVDGSCLGLLSLAFPFPSTATIYWMGVQKQAHGQGIGSLLLKQAELFCLQKNIHILTVETLSPKQADPNYLKTFQFYESHGFRPLFELHTYSAEHLMVYLHKIISPHVFDWIDLTHTLCPEIPTWNGTCGFQQTDVINYEDCPGECKFLVQHLTCNSGIGTHLDAPLHCFPTGRSVSELPLESLISPCIVINVSGSATENYLIDMPVIEIFERVHGPIAKGTFVLFYTGWSKFWDQPDKYQNNFPSITKQVAEYLVSKEIFGIGIDTLSPDGRESTFPVHQILLGSGKYIIENVANANQMPATGGFVFAMPMKIKQATEAPMRLLGMLPKKGLS